jgi:murein DD-endopeptidase MepM/ murein hydrolase activator NlpD
MRGFMRWVIVMLLGFCAGALCDAWLTLRLERERPVARAEAPSDIELQSARDERPLPPVTEAAPDLRKTNGAPLGTSGSGARPDPAGSPVAVLRERALQPPVDVANVSRWKGSFDEIHNGHRHEAVDVLAPRGTPVRAVEAGTIAKLFTSKAGGISVYQIDPSRQFVYYYAHLDGYAPGLKEGQAVQAGQMLGYVGTTGNAPANAPHLHFAIAQLSPGEGWWQGTPIDPYLVFAR